MNNENNHQPGQKPGSACLLPSIESPCELRRLKAEQLPALAAELRSTIINTVASTGGHLAPCLGVVELTLALHYIFNTPNDKIIWDVGHQCYAHKLLTGRQARFATLRQFGGISGFPKREESEFDHFDTGHSSTSISAALGMAAGTELKGENNKTIAVIGDGSMTGGLAFEGLNQAGHLGKNLIVILNDNEMSISPNVGALSSFLSRKLTGRTMVRIKKELEHLLKNFQMGENVLQLLKRSEESLKGFFTPGMLFEALKFEYIGPIPGHHLDSLLETFRNVRDFSQGPVLIHVITTKGKGYPPAEERPGDFHGVGPFEVATGKPFATEGPPSYTKVFGDTLVELAQQDPRICAITAAMPSGTGLNRFAAEFPDRFFDVGIAEQHAATFAAGLACEGLRPVVAVYSTFLQRAFDQVVHDICLPELPVIFAIDRGGVVGDDGPTHHGVFDLSFLRIIPNLILMAPKDENELRNMLFTALQSPEPVAIRYPRGAGLGVTLAPELQKIPFGKGELLQEGSDVLLLPVGNRVATALEAAAGLAKTGVSAAVINPRFVKPLDGDLICQWAGKTGRVVTVEDNVRAGGFGSAVLELLQRRGLAGVKVKTLGLPDRFLEHGSQQQLWQLAKIDAAAISAAALQTE
ncbi:1-deoxy-D-xylulose-5-phosphate synthase [Desulfurivibrio alkaliphilus]|uniref:1-deoxy-D-xylulose-5-phosphate synthase n=1 Tax=Desulfurivibrio alkaliphilus (strain DSM 19089 / UNIQEM U267 / AHT2) TaxID=589865 RepID=D6Z2F6_DESAT|nr:1-deoxy-D-xylulose-5-phosphate synthase [Desulfurivibrio alkaliphilus]ADH85731.1 deoxyxylulose-5-phosphate synthase [Desulfurivibrio alkaliphilus AHT 2]